VSYRIIFWGNSADRKNVFTLKRPIKLVAGVSRRMWCRKLCMKF